MTQKNERRRKSMKKQVGFLLALSFIFPFLVSAKAVDTQTEHEAEGISTLRSVRSSIGNDGMIPLSMDVVGIKFVVETYLAECVENMFLWKENDISCHTLDGIALRYQTNDLDTLRIDQKEFLEYRSKNETALMAASNRDNGTNIDSLYDNLITLRIPDKIVFQIMKMRMTWPPQLQAILLI